ncbi:MAG TPA: DUF5615 family PIN-like protein [Planctomycetaceae bacterium]
MTIVADESVDQPIIDRLREDGFDVVSVSEEMPGADDDSVLDRANSRGAVLLTADKDFGELVHRLGRSHAGVVLIRLDGLANADKADLTAATFRNHGDEFVGAFSVISPTSLRGFA